MQTFGNVLSLIYIYMNAHSDANENILTTSMIAYAYNTHTMAKTLAGEALQNSIFNSNGAQP